MVQCKKKKKKKEWRARYNQELHHLYRSLDIIRTIKVARLQWGGNLYTMGNNEIHRRIMDFRLEGRTVGRPKLLWMDGAVEDLRKLGTGVVDIQQG